MNYNRKLTILNKLFPLRIEVDIKTLHQCIEEEMNKSDDLIDGSLIDFCVSLIEEANTNSNVIITKNNEEKHLTKILDVIKSRKEIEKN